MRFELLRDLFCDLALDSEDIVNRTIVMLGPKMRVRSSIDQLRSHAHAISRALHAAFQHVSDPKLSSNFTDVMCRSTFEIHHTGAADHFQIADLGQVGENRSEEHTLNSRHLVISSALF